MKSVIFFSNYISRNKTYGTDMKDKIIDNRMIDDLGKLSELFITKVIMSMMRVINPSAGSNRSGNPTGRLR